MDIKELRKVCQPFESYDNLDEKIIRKFSIYLTVVFIKLKFTANMVTMVSFFVGILASILILIDMNFVFYSLALLWIIKILDYVDGEIARYNKTSSLSGLFLDRINSVVLPIFTLVFSIEMYFKTDSQLLLYFGVLASVFFILHRYIHFTVAMCLIDAKTRNEKKNPIKDVEIEKSEKKSFRNEMKDSMTGKSKLKQLILSTMIFLISGIGIHIILTLLLTIESFTGLDFIIYTVYFFILMVLLMMSFMVQLFKYSSNSYVDKYYKKIFLK